MKKKRLILVGSLIIVSLLFFTAHNPDPQITPFTGDSSQPKTNVVHVAGHGWHTGFVIESQALYNKIPELKDRFGDVENIELGWGDKGFYQANEITTGLTLQAIFTPTESVVHAVSVPATDINWFFPNSDVAKVCLSDDQLDSLIEFIAGSFAQDEDGQIIKQKKGIYGNSQFYSGVGNYYMMNTCNKWTAKGLQSAGLDISSRFKLTSGSVMSYLESLNSCVVE